MLYIVPMYTPETAECLEEENLFMGIREDQMLEYIFCIKLAAKFPWNFRISRAAHSPFSPRLVIPPHPAPLRGATESPKNRGSRSTQRPLASDLPGCLKQCQNALSELGKHVGVRLMPCRQVFCEDQL